MATTTTNTDQRGDGAGRLPSLAAQTPGMDAAQEAHTLRDAEAYFEGAEERDSRHILVPLDGSRLAAAALPYAAALARATDARLSLLAVLDTTPASVGLPSASSRENDERQVAGSAAYLATVAAPLRAAGLAVATIVRHGNPADVILADSEDEACSLVVMSTHGRTGVDRVRMGSVAQHVFRHAAIPTLVVRPGDDETMPAEAAIASVTVTLDGSALAEESLSFAVRLAAALAVPLTLLRVIPNFSAVAYSGWDAGYAGYAPLTPEMDREEEGAITAYLEGVAAPLRASGQEVRTCWRRSPTTRAEDCVAAYLEERPSGIAVMASHGRGGVLRWALGSTVEAVLDQAPCPILIVRAGATTSAGREAVPVRAMQPVG